MEGQFPFINPRGRTRLRGTFEVVRSFRQEIWWIIQYGLWVCLKIGYPQFQRIIIIIIVPITFAICGHPLFSNKPISQFSSSILVWFVQSAIAHSLVLRSMNAFNSTKWSVHVQNPGTFVFFFHVMPCPKLCNVNPGVADDDPINQLGFPKFTNPGFTLGLRARGDPKSCSNWDESARKDVFLFECLRSLPATTNDFPSRLWEIVILLHPFCQPVSKVDWLWVAMC